LKVEDWSFLIKHCKCSSMPSTLTCCHTEGCPSYIIGCLFEKLHSAQKDADRAYSRWHESALLQDKVDKI